MWLRAVIVFVGLAAVALVVAVIGLALSGGGDDSSPADGPAAADGAIVSCSVLRDLQAYRYAVSVRISGAATPSAPPAGAPSPDPLSNLGDALAQLLSDFTLEGAYVSPDRSQAILTVPGSEIELREIGEDAWVRVGDDWQREEAPAAELLTPVLICIDVIQAIAASLKESAPDPGSAYAGSDHYSLDPAKTQNLPPVLGQELSGALTVDLWVAPGQRFPQGLVIESDDPDAEEPAFRLSMDVYDVDSKEIVIEVPE